MLGLCFIGIVFYIDVYFSKTTDGIKFNRINFLKHLFIVTSLTPEMSLMSVFVIGKLHLNAM